MKEEEHHVRSEYEAQKDDSYKRSRKAYEDLEHALERLRVFEQTARDAKAEYYDVASELETAEATISKHDDDAATAKSENAALMSTNTQINNQLQASMKELLAKEEYARTCKAEVDTSDKSLITSVAKSLQLRSELQQAE